MSILTTNCKYIHAILFSNPSFSVSLDKDRLRGGANPYFNIFCIFFNTNRKGALWRL